MKTRKKTDTNLWRGDCLNILGNLETESVSLIYLDPPFFTQKTHSSRLRDQKKDFSFKDIWSSDREYATFLRLRLKEMWRVLSPTGSIFFHCDRNASHIARFLLNDVFGSEFFQAEIIWSYRRWSNARKGLLPAHQNIYYYTKSAEFVFNTILNGYSPSTNVDQILQKRERDATGKAVYQTDSAGNPIPNGGKKGVPLRDVWDIPYLNPKAKERVGYPTQKPLLLLERIIKLATNEGDTVLDPFCGSGTTLVAAKLLGRNSLGIDTSKDAIEITKKRLANPIKTESNLLKKGRNSYKNAQKELLSVLYGLDYVPVHRNKGIDAILKTDIQGEPILIKIQRPTETVLEAANLLHKASVDKNAGALFLVATQKGGYFELGAYFPEDVIILDSPALLVLDALQKVEKD